MVAVGLMMKAESEKRKEYLSFSSFIFHFSYFLTAAIGFAFAKEVPS